MKSLKRSLSVVLAFLIFFGCIPQITYASNSIANKTDTEIINDALQVVSEIESYLNSKGSSIKGELESLKKENEEQLILLKKKDNISNYNLSHEEINKRANIEEQIKMLDTAISEWNLNQDLDKNMLNDVGGSDVEVTLRLAIYSVITYFNSNNYKLAAELLGKSHANNYLDIDYYPTNGKVVRSTNTFKTLMAKPSYENSSDAFRPGSTTAEMDSYYAIHKFNYSKYGNSIMIHDRYDYENTKNYEGIAGIAIDLMYTAEVLGILTPFRTVINETK